MPHTPGALLAWQKDRAALEKIMELAPYGLELESWVYKELEDAFPVWNAWAVQFPDAHEWYLGWEIVLPEERIAIGAIGLAGPPDHEGAVLVGYHLDLRQRGKGFAAEALNGVCDWAFGDPRVKKVTATIPGWNLPSVRVAERCGFHPNGKRVEEGMELIVFERLK